MADGDNRSVHTDALATLGTIIGEGEARDAIHLAVEPVIANEWLEPGQHVGLDQSGLATASAKHLGIVDPFLKRPVQKGQRFWMVVYPRQITSLRHVWVHPDFPATPDLPAAAPKSGVDASWQWIRDYADGLTLHWATLMDGADDWVASNDGSGWGDYLVQGGTLEGESTSPEFWHHYQIVRGVVVPTAVQTNFFSCSC